MLVRSLFIGAALVGALLRACAASSGVSAETEVPPAAGPVPAPIHGQGSSLEQAVLDASLAFLREDAASAIAAMDRLEGTCRRLSREGDPVIHRDVLLYDQALHAALAKSRDLAERGDVAQAFDQFVWVQRACRQCHQMAREHGLIPQAQSAPQAEKE